MIPYTLEEARTVISKKGSMDEYHREIMCWLICEVERLEEDNKDLKQDLQWAERKIYE
jgi:uncharacterized protein (UPF0335 family)